jgi:N-acetyl-anhydromuramyl-L-alanine amidase AmpD
MPTRVLPRKIPGPKPPPVGVPPDPGTTPGYVIGSYGNPKIDKWDDVILAAVDAVKRKRGVAVNPRVMKSIMGVESGQGGFDLWPVDRCRPFDGTDNVPACGAFQVKHRYHKHRCPECDFTTIQGQAELATHVIGQTMQDFDLDEIGAFLKAYFPTDDVNGTTQREYVAKIRADVAAMTKDAGEQPAPTEPPKPAPRDIVSVIVGGRPTNTDYGWLAPAAGPFYDYFDDHSSGEPNHDSSHHTGIDATTAKGQTLYTPIKGKVVCAGTGKGPGAWGTGCAAFPDTMGNGAGRIEILTPDEKHSLILGHCSDALVDVGDLVEFEDPVGRAGGDHGWHVHIERRRFVGGRQVYILENPRLFNAPGAAPIGATPPLPPFTFLESPNRMSRQGQAPLAIVYHVSDDLNLRNVLDWLCKRGSNASSHWVIDRDGTAYQLVGSAMAAFTNGAVLNPRRDIPWLAERADAFISGRENANWYTITIEHIGKPNLPFTPEQIATSVAISRYYLHVYPTIARSRGGMMRHSDFASAERGPAADPDGRTDRSYCPGPLFPLREIILACDGDPDRLAP